MRAALALAAAQLCLAQPSFNISGDQFILDGAPVTIKSGSMHYFRVHPSLWRDRLQRMAAMGLNTVQTYVAWNWHRQDDGSLDFASPGRNLSAFFDVALELGMGVLLRPGPFICGEWEMGSLPSEMYLETPALVFRTNNTAYLAQVDAYWTQLLPVVRPWLRNNGGPIFMVQIENEYGWVGGGWADAARRS